MLLYACAAGNTFKDVSRRIPSLPLDQGRIYFLRTTVKQPDIQAAISLNAEPVGGALPNSFFFVDRAPGDYEIKVSDDLDHKLLLKLTAGQTQYVRFDLKPGIESDYLAPFALDEVDGPQEILTTEYVGPELPKRRTHHKVY